MLRSTILATVALALGAAAVLGANQLRRGNQQSQPDFGTGTVTVTIANEPGVTIVNQPGVIVTNEPAVVARQAGPWTVNLSDQPVLIWTAPPTRSTSREAGRTSTGSRQSATTAGYKSTPKTTARSVSTRRWR